MTPKLHHRTGNRNGGVSTSWRRDSLVAILTVYDGHVVFMKGKRYACCEEREREKSWCSGGLRCFALGINKSKYPKGCLLAGSLRGRRPSTKARWGFQLWRGPQKGGNTRQNSSWTKRAASFFEALVVQVNNTVTSVKLKHKPEVLPHSGNG